MIKLRLFAFRTLPLLGVDKHRAVFVLTVEACEAEHADLLRDVVPGPWGPQSLELLFQLSPHQQDPVSHGLHVVLPSATNRDISYSQTTPFDERLTQACGA